MSEIAIRATDLSKRFTLQTDRRTSLKERVVRGRGERSRELWALRDASFEVARGETFGIIGHNGSGKSTALKVLTGVYRPTSGSVEVNGRVSALLELGAGFHPELTGRENIRLNGSILSLSRRQIDALMDEIIDFSGIEDFIDSPVKVYSSGMFVRLGFAIAAKIDPDILIMDEVIAVGDEQFQRKCFDYLYQLRQSGSTIVIVSHSLAQIESMCDRAVWLDHGRVRALGPARDTVQHYIDAVNESEVDAGTGTSHTSGPHTHGDTWVVDVDFLGPEGTPTTVLLSRESAIVRIHFRAVHDLADAVLGFMFCDENGVQVMGRNTSQAALGPVAAGAHTIDYEIPDLLLNEGKYQVTTMISRGNRVLDLRTRAFPVTVRSNDSSVGGFSYLPGRWSAQHSAAADESGTLPSLSG